MVWRLSAFTLGAVLAFSVADAAPAHAQAACPLGQTRSGDRCLNAFELMTKQLNDAASKMQGSVAWLNCPQGQTTLLDSQRCVTIEPWANRTPLPDGTIIAIRLRHIMTDRQGNSAPFPQWIGLQPNGNGTIIATGSMLTNAALFTIKTFVPPAGIDSARFSLPWYALRAANGKYLKSGMVADQDEGGATLFARGWDPQYAADLRVSGPTWSQAADFLRRYAMSPVQYSTYCNAAYGAPNSPNIAFSSDCTFSKAVDFFIVRI